MGSRHSSFSSIISAADLAIDTVGSLYDRNPQSQIAITASMLYAGVACPHRVATAKPLVSNQDG
jgi:hypothetical protein